MTKRQRTVVAACADAMFPPNGAIPVSGTEAGLVEHFERYLVAMKLVRRRLLLLLLLFLQLCPWLIGPRCACFVSLDPGERLVVLQRLAVHRLYLFRVVFLSMRAILTMGYFACPAVVDVIMPSTPRMLPPGGPT